MSQALKLRGGTVAVAGLLAFSGLASLAPLPASAAPASAAPASAAPASAAPASAAPASAAPASAAPASARSVAAAALAAMPAAAAAGGTLYLPKPTGPRSVGTVALYMKDTSRPDPWVPAVRARELMISLWYPTKTRTGQRAQYMTPTESALLLKETEVPGLPADVFSTVRTNAVKGAKPAGRRHGLPLVVLSPGFKMPRTTLTALAEDLASRGYVVAGIDHTYENIAETFPDGRVTTCVVCEGDHDPSLFTKLDRVRAADVSFVLDRLTGAHPIWKGSSLIAPSRIGMAGHSAGGASTIAAMVADPRLRAGVDIDGTTDAGILNSELSRPFMFLGKPETYTPGAGNPEVAEWERDWKLMSGWKRWFLLTGAVHDSFTDMAALADEVGVDVGAGVTGARSLEITREYVGAFFDRHLLKRARPLLDKPSARYPEVKHCAPETATCK